MVNANIDTIGISEAQNAVVTVMPSRLLGDVNEDLVVDTIDALLTAQYYVGLSVANFNLADVNGDGAIDIVDTLLIAQYYVGLIPSF